MEHITDKQYTDGVEQHTNDTKQVVLLDRNVIMMAISIQRWKNEGKSVNEILTELQIFRDLKWSDENTQRYAIEIAEGIAGDDLFADNQCQCTFLPKVMIDAVENFKNDTCLALAELDKLDKSM